MRIELLEKNTVKIFLSKTEVSDHDIRYGCINHKLPENRRLIAKIVEDIREVTGLDFGSGRLFVEAFPHPKEGCVLYMSILGSDPALSGPSVKESFNTPLIFGFPTLDTLTLVCKNLFMQHSHLFLQSDLYRMDDQYILLLYSYFKMDKTLISLAQEFGQYIGRGEFAALIVKEHGKLLSEGKAVETIVESLC